MSIGIIRIIARPKGDAPEWVRDAWVGIELPLLIAGPVTMSTVSVLSDLSFWGRLLHRLGLAHSQIQTGYLVSSPVAIGLLANHALKAAEWWRDTLPRTCHPDAQFVFDEAACEMALP